MKFEMNENDIKSGMDLIILFNGWQCHIFKSLKVARNVRNTTHIIFLKYSVIKVRFRKIS